MEYTIKAHPTIYNGVEFRSRLEATWAAYFDLLGWDGKRHDDRLGSNVTSWEYEPIDLNGWTPDFVIRNKSLLGGEVGKLASCVYLIEVKPFDNKESFKDTSAYRYLLNNRPDGELGEPEVIFLGVNPNYSWRELMLLTTPMHEKHLWKQAQNITRWRPQ